MTAAESDRRRADRARVRAERAAGHLPRPGEPGPAAVRCYRRFRLFPHRATSAVMFVAYPFLAEAGLGSDGILIGRDTYSGGSFVYDPWVPYRDGVLTNPNVLLAGVIGAGKSALARSLVCRSMAFGRRAYVPGDPKGEWTPVANAIGGPAIVLGYGLTARLNPLDEGARPTGLADDQWAALVWQRRRELLGSLTETVLARPLHPVEHTALDTALTAAVRDRSAPTLPDVVTLLLDPTCDDAASTVLQLREDGRAPAHALRRLVHGDLAGLVDGPPTVRVDSSRPLVSLDLSRITGSDAMLSLIMTCASTWMEAALLDPGGAALGGRRLQRSPRHGDRAAGRLLHPHRLRARSRSARRHRRAARPHRHREGGAHRPRHRVKGCDASPVAHSGCNTPDDRARAIRLRHPGPNDPHRPAAVTTEDRRDRDRNITRK